MDTIRGTLALWSGRNWDPLKIRGRLWLSIQMAERHGRNR
jgi:hypothetical protein